MSTTSRPGAIVDDSGKAVGSHQGVHGFTIGQRKGLGVALGKPAFVTGLDPASGTVRVGDESSLYASGARLGPADLASDVSLPVEAWVRVRSRHEGAAATVGLERDPATGADVLVARFHEPVRAISPGQIAVFYRGDRVLGGAAILSAIPAAVPASSPAIEAS